MNGAHTKQDVKSLPQTYKIKVFSEGKAGVASNQRINELFAQYK